jgi:hypothetical protein
MDFSSRNGRLWGGQSARNTELSYMRLVKETHAPAWPLYVSWTCVPLGIAVMFGAILWHNHLKLRR